MDTLPMAQPTKSVDPTGGVTSPMDKFNIMIMPKWTGSIPKDFNTGKRIGVQIRSNGAMSIIVPRISSIILIKAGITYLLLDVLNDGRQVVFRAVHSTCLDGSVKLIESNRNTGQMLAKRIYFYGVSTNPK